MKRILCLLTALLIACCAPARAQTTGAVRLAFEDGFALDVPADWRYYPVRPDMAAQKVAYCLSDADAQHWLYIQIWPTDCADTAALQARIQRSAPEISGVSCFNGTDFIIYNLPKQDVSCCAALLEGQVLNFVFTPRSDADFMAAAVQLVSTFSLTA